MGHLSKVRILTIKFPQIPRSILGEGFELDLNEKTTKAWRRDRGEKYKGLR